MCITESVSCTSETNTKIVLICMHNQLCMQSCSSRVLLSATLWTSMACPMESGNPLDSSLFMGFSRQEYHSGLHALLQGIFPGGHETRSLQLPDANDHMQNE